MADGNGKTKRNSIIAISASATAVLAALGIDASGAIDYAQLPEKNRVSIVEIQQSNAEVKELVDLIREEREDKQKDAARVREMCRKGEATKELCALKNFPHPDNG